MKKIWIVPEAIFRLLVAMLLLSLLGCSIKLVAEYDEVTDRAVSQLQRKIDSFLVDLQRKVTTEEANYEKHMNFYDEVRVDISAIKVRAAARPKNEITLQLLDVLDKNLDNLERLHQLGFQNTEELTPIRSAFNTCFTAIFKFELAKKRGN